MGVIYISWESTIVTPQNCLRILCTSLFINVYYRWLNRSNSWKCSSGSRITWYILCCSSFSFCSFFRSCNCYLLWSDLQWRKDSWLKEFITFTLFQELSLSFGFNICWYSSNLFPNAFPRIYRNAKKNPGLSRFFSFLEFSVIYWIRNNSPILCYVKKKKKKKKKTLRLYPPLKKKKKKKKS